MSLSTILNLYSCGVFNDSELLQVYQDICDRLVLEGGRIEPEDEGILLQLSNKVIEIMNTKALLDSSQITSFIDPQPSTSHLDMLVGQGLPANEEFKHLKIIGERSIDKGIAISNTFAEIEGVKPLKSRDANESVDSSSFLRNWALTNNVTHTAFSELLSCMTTKPDLSSLPTGARTLLKTPIVIHITHFTTGKFYYFVISSNSHSFSSLYFVVEFPEEVDESGLVAMAVISSNWTIIEDNVRYCMWPYYLKTDAMRTKAVVNHTDLDFTKCAKCEIIVKYKTCIYNVAVSKLKRLEDASSVSQSETENGPRKRHRKRNTLLLNSDCEVSKQSSSEQTDDNAPVTAILRPLMFYKKMWMYKNQQDLVAVVQGVSNHCQMEQNLKYLVTMFQQQMGADLTIVNDGNNDLGLPITTVGDFTALNNRLEDVNELTKMVHLFY
ncbi:hypothetical protein RN001_005772 [Aquatica leii]|uniref:Uncharacterized protein n=1 Tax=Aquatica leii TaxID=1421715 RepID=A0AAN7QKJ6_9COLE|nr:hypothetical protein RN001_005772 [Aquatica leii]